MSTTQQFAVYKNYPTADETFNIPSTEMTAYDGLDYSFETLTSGAYSGSTLNWTDVGE